MIVRSLTLVAMACALVAAAPVAAAAVSATGAGSQRATLAVGPLASRRFRTVYVRLGSARDEGLLYVPEGSASQAHVALLFTHPDGNTFASLVGREMARRGYRVLMVNHHGIAVSLADYVAGISHGLRYLRSLPGVLQVVLVGYSGGGELVAFYQNAAEHGPSVCDGSQKIYPCEATRLKGLAPADGLVLMDSTLGALQRMSSIDPAVSGKGRIVSLDMFAPANGFSTVGTPAHYTPAFARRFYAAQAARNSRIVRRALLELEAIRAGRAKFSNDEPFVVPGMGVLAAGARLYEPDPSDFLAHTREPHLVLEPGGRRVTEIVRSVRPPMGLQYAHELRTLGVMSADTTVRRYLAKFAIRTRRGYAITADDIVGVDWTSAMTSTPGNAEGITVPSLVMVMTCYYLVEPGEVIFDHLASVDKTYVAIEGATHEFRSCRPECGNTVRRTFDFLNAWLSKPRRFLARASEHSVHRSVTRSHTARSFRSTATPITKRESYKFL